MLVLTVALVIDVMKPASLGFVLPGMRSRVRREQGDRRVAAVRGAVGHRAWARWCGAGWPTSVGRRASILLSAVMFVGTAICGAMPDFWWNVGMCFLMGAAAGGMLPVTYALLAETMPSKERGWVLVLVGGLGAVGGYLAASGCAAWLEPIFSWRILWFLNLPTGLVLILLNVFIPESPKYLAAQGRIDEAIRTLRGFGCDVHAEPRAPARALARDAPAPGAHVTHELAARTWALSIAAVAWGLINFGLLLWMPDPPGREAATAWPCRAASCCRRPR